MKSILGLLAAGLAALAFAIAFGMAARPGAGWLDGQWLFLVALPYNWAMLRATGASDFSPDAPAQIAAAGLFEIAFAYLAGAAVEAIVRGALRLIGRARPRA
jgi:hypothetical protein